MSCTVLLALALATGGGRATRHDADPLALSRMPALVLRVSFSATPTAGWIRVEDVAHPVRDAGRTWRFASKLLICTRGHHFISRGDLQARLRDAGLDATSFSVIGPATCTLKDGGRP